MSHFVMGIIIPKNCLSEQKIHKHIKKVLAPYNENIDVPEYKRRCFCVGYNARNESENQMERELGTWDDKREEFWNKPKNKKMKKRQREIDKKEWKKCTKKEKKEYSDIERETSYLWNKDVRDPRNKRLDEILEKHPLRHKPNPKCSNCKGTGKCKSIYNPKSKWDWYKVGGRWDGFLKGIMDKVGSENGLDFDDKHETLLVNIVTVKFHMERIKKDWDRNRCYGLVTKDGEWIEKAKMGWWGITIDKKDPKRFKEMYVNALLQAKPDDLIVSVDCHI